MTKKQFGIIFTLLALIVCVGVLAAKLNTGGLNDPSDLGQVLSQDETEKDQDVSSQKDFFYEARSEKEQSDSMFIQQHKQIVEDKNTSQEQKNDANKKISQKTITIDQENRIATNIKNKGFKDVLCYIDNDKARVVVKSENGVDDKMSATIQEIVQDVSKLTNIVIEVKK